MFITKDKKVKQSLFNQKLFTKDIKNAKQHQSSDLPDVICENKGVEHKFLKVSLRVAN